MKFCDHNGRLVLLKCVACAAVAMTLACRSELPAPQRYRTECVGNPRGVDLPAKLRDSIRRSTSYSESRYDSVAQRFPVYAGHAYPGRFFQMWFTDTVVGRAQLDTIVRFARIENPDTLPFELGQVRWSYEQLHDWFNYLSPRLMRNNKVWMSGVDLRANRIVFHVSDTVVKHETDSQLVAWKVPCGLVRLQLPRR